MLDEQINRLTQQLDDLHRTYGFALREPTGTEITQDARDRRRALAELKRSLVYERWNRLPKVTQIKFHMEGVEAVRKALAAEGPVEDE